MPAEQRKLKSFMQDWLHRRENLHNDKPMQVYREFSQAVEATRQLMFLRLDIPGVRYWQPPGQSVPFATAPGKLHHRQDVVELTRYEFVARFGDPDNL